MKTYTITPADGSKPYDLEADRAEQSPTGATEFYAGDELVGRLFNVSFRVKPTSDVTPQ